MSQTLVAPPRHLSLAVTGAGGASLAAAAMAAVLLGQPVPQGHTAPTPAQAAQRFAALSEAIRKDILQLSTAGLAPSAQTAGIPTLATYGDRRRKIDLRWAQLFEVYDLTSRGDDNPYFKINDLFGAIEFNSYLLGERIELGKVRADHTIFEAEIVAGGPQWNELGIQLTAGAITAEDILAMMNAAYENRKAKQAYTILTASGIETTTYDATGTTATEKDIRTINSAIQGILDDVYETPAYDDDTSTEEDLEGSEFALLYNPSVAGSRERVATALASNLNSPNDNLSRGQLSHEVVPIASRNVPTGGWYLVLPGRKNVFAVHRDLRVLSKDDPQIAGVATARIGQGRYKFVRGDSRQVRKANLS